MYSRLSKEKLATGPAARLLGKQADPAEALRAMNTELSKRLLGEMKARKELGSEAKAALRPVRAAAFGAFGALVCATQDAANEKGIKFFSMLLTGSVFGSDSWAAVADCEKAIKCPVATGSRALKFAGSGGALRKGGYRGVLVGSLAFGGSLLGGSLSQALDEEAPEAPPAVPAQPGASPGAPAALGSSSLASASLAMDSAAPTSEEPQAEAPGEDGAEDEPEEDPLDELDRSPVLSMLVKVVEHLCAVLKPQARAVLHAPTPAAAPQRPLVLARAVRCCVRPGVGAQTRRRAPLVFGRRSWSAPNWTRPLRRPGLASCWPA
jgi:hypothetical protein